MQDDLLDFFGGQDPLKVAPPVAPQDPIKIGPPVASVPIDPMPISDSFRVFAEAQKRQEIENDKLILDNLQNSISSDPYLYAEASDLAQKMNVPIGDVLKDVNVAKEFYRKRSITESTAWSDGSVVKSLLQDVDLAKRINWSSEALTYSERTSLAYDHGRMTVRRGELGMKMMRNTITDDERKEYSEISSRMQAMPPPSGEIFPEAARLFGQQVETAPVSIAVGVGTALASGSIALLSGVGAPAAGAVATKGYFYGSLAAGAYSTFNVETGNTFADMIDRGIDRPTAIKNSLAYGGVATLVEVVTGPLENIGFRRIVTNKVVSKLMNSEAGERVASQLFIKNYGNLGPVKQGLADYSMFAIGNVSEEGLQSVAQNFFTHMAIQSADPEFRAAMQGKGNLEEQAENVSDVMYNTFMGSIVAGIPQALFGGFGAVNSAKKSAAQSKNAIKQVEQLVKSITETTSPDAGARVEVLARMTDKYGNGDLIISTPDLTKVLDEMDNKIKAAGGNQTALDTLKQTHPEIAAQYEEAVKGGTDVVIKTADFFGKSAQTELSKEVLKYIRVVQDGVALPKTLSEAITELKAASDAQKAAISTYKKALAPFKESADRLASYIDNMLKERTDLSQTLRRAASKIMVQHAIVGASKANTMPFEWGMKFLPQVDTVTGEVLSEVASGNIANLPSQFQLEGGPAPVGPIKTETQFAPDTYVPKFGASEKMVADAEESVADAVDKGSKGKGPIIDSNIKWQYAGKDLDQDTGEIASMMIPPVFEPVAVSDGGQFIIGKNIRTGGLKLFTDKDVALREKAVLNNKDVYDQEQIEYANAVKGRTPSKKTGVPGPAGMDLGGLFIPSLNRILLRRNATPREIIHELSHAFLRNLAAADDPTSIVQFNTMLNWLGIVSTPEASSRAQWDSMSEEARESYDEAFAYSYERYVQNGPESVPREIRGVMAYFGRWLRNIWASIRREPNEIYRSLHGRDLPLLTTEAARVMDAMLSVEDDINDNDVVNDMTIIFESREQAIANGVTEQEWAEYQELLAESRSIATDESFAEFAQRSARIRNLFAREERRLDAREQAIRDRLKKAALARLHQERVHNARRWIESGVMATPQGDQTSQAKQRKISTSDAARVFKMLLEDVARELADVKQIIRDARAENQDPAEVATLQTRLKDIRVAVKAIRDRAKKAAVAKASKQEVDAINREARPLNTEAKAARQRIDEVRRANPANADIQEYERYADLLQMVINTGSAQIMASAQSIFKMSKRANKDAVAQVQQAREEIYAAILAASEKAVQRSPLYVFKDIRSLARAKSSDKLDRADLERVIMAMLSSDSKLQKMPFGIKVVDAAAIGSRAGRSTAISYAKTRKDMFDALLIEEFWKVYSTAKDEKINEAKKKFDDLRNKLNARGNNTQEQEKLLVDKGEKTFEGLYQATVSAGQKLYKLMSGKGRLTREQIDKIHADSLFRLETEFPEYSSNNLAQGEVTREVRNEVNRRIADIIIKKYFEARNVVSDAGVKVYDYWATQSKRYEASGDLIWAFISAKSEHETAVERADAIASGKIKDRSGLVDALKATNSGVARLALDNITSDVTDENLAVALEGYVTEEADGLSVGQVRDMFGFSNETDVIYQLLTADTADQLSDEQVEEQVAKQHPEYLDRQQREAIINHAVQNAARQEVLEAEMGMQVRMMLRVAEAGLSEEERARREAVREERREQLVSARTARERQEEIRNAARSVNDDATANIAQAAISGLDRHIRVLLAQIGEPLVSMDELRAAAQQEAEHRLSLSLVRDLVPARIATAQSRMRRAAQVAATASTGTKGNKVFGDIAAYVEARYQEMVLGYMARMSYAQQRQIERIRDLARTIMGGDIREVANERNIDYVFAARAIAVMHGLAAGDINEAIARIDRIRDYNPQLHLELMRVVAGSLMQANAESVRAANREAQRVASGGRPRARGRLFMDMEMGAFLDLGATLEMMWESARDIRNMELEQEQDVQNWYRENAIQTIGERIAENRRTWRWRRHASETIGRERQRAAALIAYEKFVGSNRKIELYFYDLDGGQRGFFSRKIWDPIKTGALAYRRRLSEFSANYTQIVNSFGRMRQEGRILAPELTRDNDPRPYEFGRDNNFGIAELFWILMHVGNPGNYRRMLVGMGWATINNGVIDDSKWRAFYERALREGIIDDNMLEHVKRVGDLASQFFPEMDVLYRRVMAVPINRLDVWDVQGQGRTFEGWYMPAFVDRVVSEQRAVTNSMERIEDTLAAMSEDFQRMHPAIAATSGLDRNDYYEQYSRTLRFDPHMIVDHIEAVLRFIHLHDPISRAVRLFGNHEVQSMLNEDTAFSVTHIVMPWLQDTARMSGSKATTNVEWDRAVNSVTKAALFKTMFANVKVTVENITGLFPAMDMVGAGRIASVATRFATPLSGWSAALSYAATRSEDFRQMLTSPLTSMSSDMRTIVDLNTRDGMMSAIKLWTERHSTLGHKQTQMWVSAITWIAAYERFYEESRGADVNAADLERQAVLAADSAMRITHGAHGVEDRTAFERGVPLARMMALFSGWFNNVRQLTGSRVRRILASDLGIPEKAGRVAGVYAMHMFIPTMISAALVEYFYDNIDDDDPEKWSKLTQELLFYSQLKTVASGFPIIGQATISAANFLDDESYNDKLVSSAPIAVIESMLKFLRRATDKDVDVTGKDIRNVIDFAASYFNLPPVGRLVGYPYSVATDQVEPTGFMDYANGILQGQYKVKQPK